MHAVFLNGRIISRSYPFLEKASDGIRGLAANSRWAVSASADKTIGLWDLRSGTLSRAFTGLMQDYDALLCPTTCDTARPVEHMGTESIILPDGRIYGTTSVTLVALAADAVRYDFQPHPGNSDGWYPVNVG